MKYSDIFNFLRPVINVNDLRTRLHNTSDVAAYVVATAVAAVVMERAAQLDRGVEVSMFHLYRRESKRFATESETARAKLLYQQNLSTRAFIGQTEVKYTRRLYFFVGPLPLHSFLILIKRNIMLP